MLGCTQPFETITKTCRSVPQRGFEASSAVSQSSSQSNTSDISAAKFHSRCKKLDDYSGTIFESKIAPPQSHPYFQNAKFIFWNHFKIATLRDSLLLSSVLWSVRASADLLNLFGL